MPDVEYIPPGEKPKRKLVKWPTHRIVHFHKGKPIEKIDLVTLSDMDLWQAFRSGMGFTAGLRNLIKWASKSTARRRPAKRKKSTRKRVRSSRQ